ncbi:threonine/serine dehydratase [Polyangium aurulentum]|uniref:threonine/serine dehydratase n=1 Tax=Polyangium aurulentum TaxID=2567896 RepID=UPI0010AEAF98|nr:threonine/serine dehydratase [Polyangium aurulentum]UQA55515.1 threonine/serine dehydratase [Polyangium aurulentum]
MDRAAVLAAWQRIGPYVRRTPVIELSAGDLGLDHPVVVKLEASQHAGSFKARGAFHKLLSSRLPEAGVIAASGGNHGVAVAHAARTLGVRAEIFVPTICGKAKVERLASCGAVVRQEGAVYGEALVACGRRAAETGALAVHAYEDPVVIAGAGTASLEFAEQAAFDTLLVAVGGGGLIAGACAAVGAEKKIVAVETHGTPTLHSALEAGKPVDVPISGLAADALGASRVGAPNFELIRSIVAASLLVSDDDVRAAQRALWRELRVVAEPAGATALAALLSGAYRPERGERVGVMVCGANTDPASVI